MAHVLLVDDEATLRLALGDALAAAGFEVSRVASAEAAWAVLSEHRVDVAVLDVRLPGVSGLSLFRQIREGWPECDVVLMTAYGSVQDAVNVIRGGAGDYLVKPFDSEVLVSLVRRLVEHRRVRAALEVAREQLAARRTPLIGASPAMVRLNARLRAIAGSDAAVLIVGESGTGKELVARAIHEQSARRAGPYVPVNIAALPEALLEAELFGHERGAFTGAIRKRSGRFHEAEGGTLVLDEIGELPLSSQVKLLRVLEDNTYQPIGSNTSIKADCRVLSITHQSLKRNVSEGRFRQDLYYRIRVLEIEVPPLRERRGDLPLLVAHFLARHQREGQPPLTLSPGAWLALQSYPFPGNVRELEHALEHAAVLAGGREIEAAHLPADLLGEGDPPSPTDGEIRPLTEVMRELERHYLSWALRTAGGKKGRVAELLGISRKNLWEKLRAHGLSEHPGEEDSPGEVGR